MAIIKVNFFSKSLVRNIDVNVILPIDKFSLVEDVQWNKKPFKTLYLLHGVFGDCNDWITNTRIALWAQEKNLAVVMPSGENFFYLNMPGIDGDERKAQVGDQYSDFIGKELVEFTRNCFPLSTLRDDTFIAGLSMGGYGALINGLKFNQTFSHIAALSPALMIDDAINSSYKKSIILRNRAFFERFFGDLTKLKESEKNPYYLVNQLKNKILQNEKIEFPNIYLACGSKDHLYPRVEDFKKFLDEQKIKAVFEFNDGDHDWKFWDEYIQHVLNWLPL